MSIEKCEDYSEEDLEKEPEVDGRIKIDKETEKRLRKAGYGVYNHSTIEICHWQEKALEGEMGCYKVKFYGIEALRCMQFSPSGMFCQNRCVYCWRPTEFYKTLKLDENKVDEPEEIFENLLKEWKRLLTGFGGNPKVNRKVFEYVFNNYPSHYAISLSGEPTMYPKLPKLIKFLKSLPSTKSVFLVTNGQEPEMLEKLQKEDALPTQLYLSMNAADAETFKRVNVPLYKDAWERWNKSLEFLSRASCRTVIRITLIRSLNYDKSKIPLWAELIKKGNPHFIEIKSYMHLGLSTKRLKREDMLKHEEVKEWAFELLKYLPNFEYMDEDERSRIVVLQNKERYVNRWIIPKKEISSK
ncbi:MAG: 4-demethylwyosine synthase TYW1 [Candidatus Aenigmatarchaeota archaeon]